jgi:hypothetical protein
LLFELIATITSGLGAAGVVLLLRHLSGGRLPKGLVPTAAGAAMVAFVIWNDYSWFERTSGGLPDRVEVIAMHSDSAAWRPWTYVFPLTERFTAIDRGSMRQNDQAPGITMVDVLLFARRAPVTTVPMMIDCQGMRRADLVDGDVFDPDGTVSGVPWYDLPAGDPLLDSVCAAA